ncbi:DNA-directed primase/polymerase protein-like [Lineus longissimus]|uniref:DNA-directed primase/polymerase protein-like n=1 Tax=Lineus longissimus TaxID=88925 RepID=UPI002B4D9ED8
MSFSKAAFYGNGKKTDDKRERQWHDRLKNIANREAHYKAHPSPKEYRPKIDDPCIYRKTFFRQQDAFEYARSKSEDLHVFAYESSSFQGENSGKRMYMVCSYPHFWHFYRQMMKQKACHHYEVIPEGAVCKLYFDLEFLTAYNPKSCGDKMVHTFIELIDYHLEKHYNITTNQRQVVDLQSHNPSKFSRHLIYLIKGAAFKDNIHAGNFVNHVCSQLMDVLRPKEEVATEDEPSRKKLRRSSRNKSGKSDDAMSENDAHSRNVDVAPSEFAQKRNLVYFGIAKSRLEELLVRDRDRNEVLFVDLGVYTKNRNFRLFKSSKLGKGYPMEYRQTNYYTVSTPIGRGPVEQIYLDSMVTNVKFCPYLRLLTWEENVRIPLARRNSNPSCSKNEPKAAPLEGYSSSPFPEIDEFIASILNIGGIQGSIRRWSYFTQGELLVYEIAKYRWCENIRRHHKSNNIMFLVDVKNGVYYQKCHDPECKRINFKSDEYPLPRELLPSYYINDSTDFEDDFLEEVSDKDLLTAASGAELSVAGNSRKCCVYNQVKAVKSDSCLPQSENTTSAGGVEAVEMAEDEDGELLEVLDQVEHASPK